MGRRILIVIFSIVFLTLGCQGNQQTTNDILVVLKRVGTENKHENYKEIIDKKTIVNIKSMLKKGDWEKTKVSMSRPPDYKIYFKPINGEDALSVQYDVWFTNKFAEIYIEVQGSYKKLSKEDSAELLSVIS